MFKARSYFNAEVLFALASGLYVFKVFRAGPVGPDLICLLFLLIGNFKCIFQGYYKKKVLLASIIIYMTAIISSLIGSLGYYIQGNMIGEKNYFDLFAVTYSFILCLIYGSSIRFLNSNNLFSNTLFFLLLLNVLLLPFYYNQEGGFQGFSGNANQIASFSVYTGIFCFLIKPKMGILKWGSLLIFGILIGIYSRSDASLFFYIILFPLAILVSRMPVGLAGSYRVLLFLFFAIIATSLVIIFYNLQVGMFATAIEKLFQVRFALWGDYLEILEKTYGVGFGTGKYASPVMHISFGETEAHNTILDLSVSFGLLTGITVSLLLMYTLFMSIRYISFSYSILFCGVIAQSLVMTLYRHPLFWLLIIATLIVASTNAKQRGLVDV